MIFRELIQAVIVIDLLDAEQLLLRLRRREKSRSSRQRRIQPISLIAWVIKVQIVVDGPGDRTLGLTDFFVNFRFPSTRGMLYRFF